MGNKYSVNKSLLSMKNIQFIWQTPLHAHAQNINYNDVHFDVCVLDSREVLLIRLILFNIGRKENKIIQFPPQHNYVRWTVTSSYWTINTSLNRKQCSQLLLDWWQLYMWETNCFPNIMDTLPMQSLNWWALYTMTVTQLALRTTLTLELEPRGTMPPLLGPNTSQFNPIQTVEPHYMNI
jgi:hypothetical protein